MEEFVLKAKPRSVFGSRAARRLRAEGLLPANIYGHREANVAVCLEIDDFKKFFEAGHRVVTVEVDGKPEPSVVKEVQYDAMGNFVLHVDFTRVSKDEKIKMEVPVETVGVPKGTSSAGGVLEMPHREISVEGFPRDIPERIEINIEALKVGESIRVKDVPVPANCEFVDDPEQVIVHVAALRGDELEEAVEGEEKPPEPEVIGRKKDEAEGTEEDK